MSSRLPNQYPTVITRDFTTITIEDDAERHILELKGSLSDGTTSYDKTTGQEMGILFSARQICGALKLYFLTFINLL